MSRRVYTSKRESIELTEKPFASGGEGAIFKVLSSPSYLRDVCVKIYHPNVVDKKREDRIKYMVQNPPSTIRGDHYMMGWPMEYVTDKSRRFIGFVMPLGFPGSKELVVLTSTNLSKNLDSEWWDRYDRSMGIPALVSRLKLICNIAIPVHILHSTGKYVLKDFKPQNVLATADGRITICDMDSIQIAEGKKLLYPGTAATPEYIPPECYTKGVGRQVSDVIQPSWDSFAIGTVFYQLLFGIHPYVVTPKVEQGDGSNDISHNISSNLFPFGVNYNNVKVRPKPHDKFSVLPKDLKDMFIHTFTDDIGHRPDAEMWGRLIYKLITDAEKAGVKKPVRKKAGSGNKGTTTNSKSNPKSNLIPNTSVNTLTGNNSGTSVSNGKGSGSSKENIFNRIGCFCMTTFPAIGAVLGYAYGGIPGAFGFAVAGFVLWAVLHGIIGAIIGVNN